MAEAELRAKLQENFYRSDFGKIVFLILILGSAILLLIFLSIYLYYNEPEPMVFKVDNEWRVQPAIPLDQPHLSTPDLLQWTSDALQKSLVFDFIHFNDQLKSASQFFTPDGWKTFLDQLNIYINHKTVHDNKLFVEGIIDAAPYILREGLLGNRYAWWIQIPININYAGYNPPANKLLTFQVLVVRVSTLNNLMGVGIDKVILAPEKSSTG